MQGINNYLLSGLLICCLLSGCSNPAAEGNGTLTDQNIPLKDIQNVKISGHFIIHINQNPNSNLLKVHTDQNLQPLLNIKQHDSLLTIDSSHSLIKPSKTPELTLTLSTLTHVEINGDNIIDLNQIKTPLLQLVLNGHQRAHLTGKALRFDLTAIGDNTLEAKNFSAKKVSIVANGHNNLVIACQNADLSIKANGANAILYVGKPLHLQEKIIGNTTVTTV